MYYCFDGESAVCKMWKSSKVCILYTMHGKAQRIFTSVILAESIINISLDLHAHRTPRNLFPLHLCPSSLGDHIIHMFFPRTNRPENPRCFCKNWQILVLLGNSLKVYSLILPNEHNLTKTPHRIFFCVSPHIFCVVYDRKLIPVIRGIMGRSITNPTRPTS